MTTWYTDTVSHIRRVQALLDDVVGRLLERARNHDASKLAEPEASVFAEFTSKLKGCTYGSPEYKNFLDDMRPALDHHYAVNSHHPEHYEYSTCDQCGSSDAEPCTCGGTRTKRSNVAGMSLLDMIEMVCDWKAATERHADGDIAKSLNINRKRFAYGDEIDSILRRTVAELWPAHIGPWHCFGCGAGGMQGNFCEMCGSGKNGYLKK